MVFTDNNYSINSFGQRALIAALKGETRQMLTHYRLTEVVTNRKILKPIVHFVLLGI